MSNDVEDDEAINAEKECTHLSGVSSIVAVNQPERDGGPDGRRALVDFFCIWELQELFLYDGGGADDEDD